MMQQDRVSASTAATIQNFPRAIANAPGDEFHCSSNLNGDEREGDLSFYELDSGVVLKMSYTGIFELQGCRRPSGRSLSRVKVWTCPPEYRERAQAVLDGWESPVGCGHTGVRNIPGGGFTCTTDGCDVEVPRDEVNL